MSKQLVVPVVHLNGSSKQSLIDQYAKAVRCLNELEAAVRQIETHDRDYYVNDAVPNAGLIARAQKQEWLQMLSAIENDLRAIVYGVVTSKKTVEVDGYTFSR